MESCRNLKYDDVMQCISEIFKNNNRFCKHDVKYCVNPDCDDGFTQYDTCHPVGSRGYVPIRVFVGVKSLENNMTVDGYVKDEDAVWCVQQAFHESAHVWQYSVGYMQLESDDLIKNMARSYVVGLCFPEYRRSLYLMDSSEIFADKYAIDCVSDFFEEKSILDGRFGNIDVNRIVCENEIRRYGSLFGSHLEFNTVHDVSFAFSDVLDVVPFFKRFNISLFKNMNSNMLSHNLRKFLKMMMWLLNFIIQRMVFKKQKFYVSI